MLPATITAANFAVAPEATFASSVSAVIVLEN